MKEEVDNANDIPRPLMSGKNPKRLRSKVWDDFIPNFVDGKIATAECMHCHKVFNSKGTTGTSNLLKHQATCSPRAQKRPMQQKLTCLASIQKSTVSLGSDPTQKKLPFLPTNQKTYVGTADEIPQKKGLALFDVRNDTTQKSQDVDQNGSHEELATPEHEDYASPDIPSDTIQKSQEVDQNGSHQELVTTELKDLTSLDIPNVTSQKSQEVDQKRTHEELDQSEQKNPSLPNIPINKNLNNQSDEELALPEQKGITDTSLNNQEVGEDGNYDELIRKLAIHGYLPSMMDHGGLRKSVNFLNPMYKMPSYADLMCKLLSLFDKERAKLKEKFAGLCSRICLSVYAWHYDPVSAFLCLSVHYIDDEWERQQNIIGFRSMDAICNAEELSDVILMSIQDWGLCDKVFSIILDDAFVDDSVASNVKAHLQKQNSACANPSLFVVRYGTHLLNQVIQVGLDELNKIMEKSVNCSKYKVGPNSSAIQYRNYKYAPSQEEWSEARKMCETLEDFHQYIDTVQCLRGPVHLFDKIWEVNGDLHRSAEFYKDGSFSNMIKKMQQKFRKYWKVCCLHLCMPVIMDPSHRLEHIIDPRRSYKSDREDCIREVRDILLSLFYEYSGQAEDPSSTSGSKTSEDTIVKEDDMTLEYSYLYRNQHRKMGPMTELDQFLYEPNLCSGLPNVLQWWKEHNVTYPTIARIAQDILAVPHSTDYEVATTTARLAICESGHGHWVEQLVCTQDWLGPDSSASEMSTSDLLD